MEIYTKIYHGLRLKMGLSLSEYCLADLIHRLSTNQEAVAPGWCTLSKIEMAKTFGISKEGLHKILNRLGQLGIIDKDKTGRKYKTTSQWLTAENREQSTLLKDLNSEQSTLKEGTKYTKIVNKVHQNSEQSTPYINIHKDNNNKTDIYPPVIDYLIKKCPTVYQAFAMRYSGKLKNYERMLWDFHYKAEAEEIQYSERAIMGRLNGYASRYLDNEQRAANKTNNQGGDISLQTLAAKPLFR